MDQDTAKTRNTGAGLIHQRPASRRNPVHRSQAEFLAVLIRELIDEYRLETEMQERELELSEFFVLPAYLRLMTGAPACGFVCRDFRPDFPIGEMLHRPSEGLANLSFPMLRHYVHTLIRAEVWGAPWGSPVRQALDAGALEVLHDRLLNDRTLYEAP